MPGIKKAMAGYKLRLMRKKYEAPEISLPDDIRKTACILVCLPPGQRQLTMIKQLLPDLVKVFPEAEIYLMATPGHNVYDIFPRKGFRIMSPSTDHLSWSGLASNKYIGLLQEKEIDLILDFNLGANQFTQSILLSIPGAVKIGNANSLGTPYYNLEIKTRFIRDEKNIYKSMIDTIDSLKNSRSYRAKRHLN